MQEEIGTGGAGFRFMYAAFLQEAAEVLGKPELNEISEKMTATGDRWREFAIQASRIYKDRNNDQLSYEGAADILMDISNREKEVFTDLKLAMK